MNSCITSLLERKMKRLERKAWNLRLKKILSIGGVKKIPKLPKKRGYSHMFKDGLTPVQAAARILKSEDDFTEDDADDVEGIFNDSLKNYYIGAELDSERFEDEEGLGFFLYMDHPFFDDKGILDVNDDLERYLQKKLNKSKGRDFAKLVLTEDDGLVSVSLERF